MARVSREIRSRAGPTIGGGYQADIGVSSGPLSGGVFAAGAPISGQPQAAGANVGVGPLSAQFVQPTFKGAQPSYGVGFNADEYFGANVMKTPQGMQYGVRAGPVSASYNPTRKDLSIMGGFERRFADGGPVLTSKRIASSFVPPEEQGAISPSMEGVVEGAQAVGRGLGPALQATGEYITNTAPGQVLSDVGTLAGGMYEAAKQNPAEFIGGMLPGVGNIYALKDIAELKDKIALARAAGDEETALKLEKFAPLAAVGAAAPFGAGAAVGAVTKAAERAAVKGVEKTAIRGAADVVAASDKAAAEGIVKAADHAAAVEAPQLPSTMFQPEPVIQAFDNVPAPDALRSTMVGEITKSIDESDGAVAKLPTTMGLGPMYVVNSGVEPTGKGFILAGTTNKNAAKQIDGIEPLMQKYPDMALNPESWAAAMTEATGNANVVAPPYRFMKAIQDGEYEQLLRTLTEGQIKDADAGFANGKAFLQAYNSGAMNVEDTGKLFMWGMLSRGVDPFTHEGLFLDSFKGIEPWIKMAAEGKFTKEVAEGPYKDWAATTAPKGSGQAGAGAMHNLNAFGNDFLVKMGTPGEDGITPMQRLHNLMSNSNMSGREIRRAFAETGEGVGIDNKVVSFILLATGRDDVMVIDRIQLKNLWDDGRFGDVNIWDGVSVPVVKTEEGVKRFAPTDEGRAAAREYAKTKDAKVKNAAVTGSSLAEATYGAKGILVYEAIEDALMKQVGGLYEKLGRPQAASPGRFHWETWVARSNQEASHGTLGSILAKGQGKSDPLADVYSKQGDYQTYAYGAKYGVSAEGPYYMYPLSSGQEVRLTPQALATVLEDVKNPKYGVVPKGFKVSETTGRPWYEREGVNRTKLDELINAAANRSAGGQAGVVRKAAGGSVSDGDGLAGGAGNAAGTQDTISVTESVMADIADSGLDRRQIATLLRMASTGTLAPDKAMEFADSILTGDIADMERRFQEYPRSMRILSRVDAAVDGTSALQYGSTANRNPGGPLAYKAKPAGYAKGGVVKGVRRGGGSAFEEIKSYGMANFGDAIIKGMANRAGGDPAKLMFAMNQYTKNLAAQDPETYTPVYRDQIAAMNEIAQKYKINTRAAFRRDPAIPQTIGKIDEAMGAAKTPAFKQALQRMQQILGG